MPSPDVQRIIDRILASPRAQSSRAFAGRIYTDEPILRTGSQMAAYFPERCRQMRELANTPELRRAPEAKVFYEQAKFMEDYEDSLPFNDEFRHYFPTYQAMSNRQLRGYFTWRTAVRAGRAESAPLSFMFVYIYELLCGVGIDEAWVSGETLAQREAARADMTQAERGYWALRDFWGRYSSLAPQLDSYLGTWLRSYVIWHGLDRSLIKPHLEAGLDTSYLALRDGIASWGERTRGDDRPAEPSMYAALNALASYRPAEGRLGRDKSHGKTLRHVCCAAVVAWADHCARHRKTGLLDGWFGEPRPTPVTLFAQAVFWSDGPHPDTTYEIDEVNRYICKNGRWAHVALAPGKKYRSELGMLLHGCDQRLRVALGYRHQLKEKPLPKYLAKIVDAAIETRLGWEHEREARTVHVDLSALAGIRAAASATREALLVDEEREDETTETMALGAPTTTVVSSTPTGPSENGEPACPAARRFDSAPKSGAPLGMGTAPAVASESEDFGLTADELALLHALLTGTAWEPPAESSLDMLVDSINEKLFDLLGDTALEFVSGAPAIIDDYLEDVREALGHD